MKNMVNILPKGNCPNCTHGQFVVLEQSTDEYLTNRDGEIVDHHEDSYSAVGCCCNCGHVYRMYPTSYGFIPLTKLRGILFDDYDIEQFDEPEKIKNPMEK